jgi:hypothetical protein
MLLGKVRRERLQCVAQALRHDRAWLASVAQGMFVSQAQYPVAVFTRCRSDSWTPPLSSKVWQARAMSPARVSTISRLSVSYTRARISVTSCASGGSV